MHRTIGLKEPWLQLNLRVQGRLQLSLNVTGAQAKATSCGVSIWPFHTDVRTISVSLSFTFWLASSTRLPGARTRHYSHMHVPSSCSLGRGEP